jgi:hypothetical protein
MFPISLVKKGLVLCSFGAMQRNKKLKDALHQFMDYVLGGTPKEQRWMDV